MQHLAPHRGSAHLVGISFGRHVVRQRKVIWDGRDAVWEIGEDVWWQGGFEKGDDRGELQDHDDKLETVDVQVSGVFVMEVKSVTHIGRPHDVEPETEHFLNFESTSDDLESSIAILG